MMRVNNMMNMTMPVDVRVQAQQAATLNFGADPKSTGSDGQGNGGKGDGKGGRGNGGRTINPPIQF